MNNVYKAFEKYTRFGKTFLCTITEDWQKTIVRDMFKGKGYEIDFETDYYDDNESAFLSIKEDDDSPNISEDEIRSKIITASELKKILVKRRQDDCEKFVKELVEDFNRSEWYVYHVCTDVKNGKRIL